MSGLAMTCLGATANGLVREMFGRVPCLAAYLAAIVSLTAPAAAAETVNGLRQDGWVVIEKQGRIEQRPGLPPYETMVRAVHVTTFVMEKDGRRKVCTLAYDSQRDTFAEECRDTE